MHHRCHGFVIFPLAVKVVAVFIAASSVHVDAVTDWFFDAVPSTTHLHAISVAALPYWLLSILVASPSSSPVVVAVAHVSMAVADEKERVVPLLSNGSGEL